MQRFDIDGRTHWLSRRFIAEHTRRPLKELVFPLFDLGGMRIKLLGQFHQRLLSATFVLKAGLWFPRGRLGILSPVPGIYAKVRNSTYPGCAELLSRLFHPCSSTNPPPAIVPF